MPFSQRMFPVSYGFHSLAVRISLMLMVMTLAVYAAVSGAVIVFERQKNIADIYRNGETFATFSALPIYENYTQFYTHPEASDFQNFKQNVSAILAHDKDILNVEMVTVDGRILFSSDEFKSEKYSSSSPRVATEQGLLDALDKDTASRVTVASGGKSNTLIVVPVQEAGVSGHFASMVYRLSFDSLQANLLNSLQQLSLIALPLLVLMAIASFIFAITLVRPISKLTEVAGRLRGGDLDARAKTNQTDELGRLALTLNQMASQIQQNISALRWDRIQLRSSINSVNVGLIIIDNDFKVFLMNAEAEHILSYEVDGGGLSKTAKARHDWTTDLIEIKLHQTFSFKKALADIRTKNQPAQFPEVEFNGRVLRIFMSPIADSEAMSHTLGTVVLLEDITEQKILERSKDEFFSLASHELRTPLTAIRGNTSMIQDYYKDVLKDASLKELITDTHDASIRLIGIVNDFLDVSRAEQGKMAYKLTSFNIAEVAAEVLKDMAGTLEEKQISATFSQSDPDQTLLAYADKDRITQVIYNLVGNASKFTPPKGQIRVIAEAQDQILKVQVEDTGTGISPEMQQLLFHKFQQAGASLFTRNTERGTGLGLYICKLMLEQMGGGIKLESSTQGKGSVFSFTLPRFKG